MIYDNGYDPEPESDYSAVFKELDINFEIYGNSLGITSEETKLYLISRY